MKLIKSANNRAIIKMSRKEWTEMGKKAGWLKESASQLYQDKLRGYDSIQQFDRDNLQGDTPENIKISNPKLSFMRDQIAKTPNSPDVQQAQNGLINLLSKIKQALSQLNETTISTLGQQCINEYSQLKQFFGTPIGGYGRSYDKQADFGPIFNGAYIQHVLFSIMYVHSLLDSSTPEKAIGHIPKAINQIDEAIFELTT